MITYNPLLCLDFYKTCHAEQYPKGLTKMVSYYTPRMSRLGDTDKVTLFGLQAFIQEYLIEAFNDHFFNVPFDSVLKEYTRVLGATIRTKGVGEKRLRELHDLGYLPLQIRAVPEGTRTNIKVPQIEISNTHPNFVWLVNTIETMLSCTMWHTQVSAEVGYRYRKIVNEYAERTCDDNVVRARLLGDFSMRGQESVESATKSAAAFCLSFLNTATVPAILWLEHNYNCDCSKEPVAYGALSTEHSVMCSNFAVDGDEVTQIRRLLCEVYPHQSFSMVSDSYDYWNLVEKVLPQLKDDILNHDGFISIRGDSGDPVSVITETVYRLWDIFGDKRTEINAELDTYLREKFDQYGIIIDTVNFTDISVDDETAAAIQKKVTAQQELELANIEKQTAKVQAEKDREVAQINAEKAVIEAEAKAETLRIAAEAEADANRKIAASLTNELIEKIKYEQWNGELPTVTGSTPIISLEP